MVYFPVEFNVILSQGPSYVTLLIIRQEIWDPFLGNSIELKLLSINHVRAYSVKETLRLSCLNERNVSLVAICVVI